MEKSDLEKRVDDFCLAIKQRVKAQLAFEVNKSRDKNEAYDRFRKEEDFLTEEIKILKGVIIKCR